MGERLTRRRGEEAAGKGAFTFCRHLDRGGRSWQGLGAVEEAGSGAWPPKGGPDTSMGSTPCRVMERTRGACVREGSSDLGTSVGGGAGALGSRCPELLQIGVHFANEGKLAEKKEEHEAASLPQGDHVLVGGTLASNCEREDGKGKRPRA